jgi:stearoyl-CoA desaturase (delta-9 desaturase)
MQAPDQLDSLLDPTLPAARPARTPPDGTGERRWPPAIVLRLPGGARLRVNPVRVLSIFTLLAIAAGSIAGVWWFATHGITWFEPVLLLGMTFVTGIGVTLGYHRLFSHRAFVARPSLAAALGILGAMAMQGQISAWASIHRKHHRYSDRAGDPHSPRPRGPGAAGAIRGFIEGHVGWVVSDGYCTWVDYVRDLRRDPVVAWVDGWYWLWVAAGWVLPGFVGLAWYGGWDGYWAGFFAGGPLRTLCQINFTWAVNSVAHCCGGRRFATTDDSRNNVIVNALCLNGEGLHNNHHAFPWSARFSHFPGEVDIGWWVLRGCLRLGLADAPRVPSAALVARRAAAVPRPAASR